MRKLNQERLKELLHYDPETGVFRWRVKRGSVQAGSIVKGFNGRGYRRVRIDSCVYLAHRLAFLYMEGYLPEHFVDHINGDTDDNRWCNLRQVSQVCNMQNCGPNTANTSGFPGVSWSSKRQEFRAYRWINYKQKSLGYYKTALDAALARLTFEVQCPLWTCNHRSVLIKVIKEAWPEFNERSLN